MEYGTADGRYPRGRTELYTASTELMHVTPITSGRGKMMFPGTTVLQNYSSIRDSFIGAGSFDDIKNIFHMRSPTLSDFDCQCSHEALR